MENINTTQKMTLKKSFENRVLTITLSGRIDISNVDKLKDAIMPELNIGLKGIVLDFENVDMIFSCTLRLLLQISQMKPSTCSYSIIQVNPTIMQVFEMTGFDKILDINPYVQN